MGKCTLGLGSHSTDSAPDAAVFVANLQHGYGKGEAGMRRLLPQRIGWIVSAQAADRRPLLFWGSKGAGGPDSGGNQPDRIPRLKQLGLEV
jgi:hypothetical protein